LTKRKEARKGGRGGKGPSFEAKRGGDGGTVGYTAAFKTWRRGEWGTENSRLGGGGEFTGET